MMRELGDRIEVSGAMTMAAAAGLLAEGAAMVARSDAVFDLSGVTEVDSSGLAVVFGWQRAAKRLNKDVRIANLPHSLRSLADVYGVGALLPL
ncbi:MAG: STAS domain-containing protein [Rhodocyclaceae bacterium]|nr:STAS domain-containing protein [Rhodocyclaceae bacterium]